MNSLSITPPKQSLKARTWVVSLCSICIVCALSSCSPSMRFTSVRQSSQTSETLVRASESSSTRTEDVITGLASYYGDEFQGRMTSNGEVFDQQLMTAAHRTFAFGTVLRVTNLRNNKSVVVRVNDRGPFSEGRVLDLSRSAAEKLDMLREGIARVSITILN